MAHKSRPWRRAMQAYDPAYLLRHKEPDGLPTKFSPVMFLLSLVFGAASGLLAAFIGYWALLVVAGALAAYFAWGFAIVRRRSRSSSR